MISRSLGAHAGSAVGLVYWLGIILLAVMEALGAAELIGATRIQAVLFIAVLALISRTQWVERLSMLFAAAVVMSMGIMSFGLASHALGSRRECSILRSENSGFSQSVTDIVPTSPLSLLFTLYAGIFSGADRADTLRDSPRSISLGTQAAIALSTILYLWILNLWHEAYKTAGVIEPLRNHSSPDGIKLLSWATPAYPYLSGLLVVGIVSTCTAQVMQCFVVAPKLLYEIAKDRTVPGITWINSQGRALMLSVGVGSSFCTIRSLDEAAPIVSMCFLLCYGFVCLACAVQSALAPPSWRPSLRILTFSSSHKDPEASEGTSSYTFLLIVSFVGTGLCGYLMAEISQFWATVVAFFLFALWFLLTSVGESAEWGSGWWKASLALALLSGRQDISRENWRPHVLVVAAPDDLNSLMSIVSELKRGRGLTLVVGLAARDRFGIPQSMEAQQTQAEEITAFLAREGLKGFTNVIEEADFQAAVKASVELGGLGALKPNTVLLSWGMDESFVRAIEFSISRGKAVVACKGDWGEDSVRRTTPHQRFQSFEGPMTKPQSSVLHQRTLDIWWFLQDGGLLLCLAWLLTQHANWAGTRVRIFVACRIEAEAAPVEESLRGVLKRTRVLIEAEIHAVVLEDERMLEPYAGVGGSVSEPPSPNRFPGTVHDLLRMTRERNLWPEEEEFGEESRSSALSLPMISRERAELLESLHSRLRKAGSVPATPPPSPAGISRAVSGLPASCLSFARLNLIVKSRSATSDAVLLNLPNIWGTNDEDCLVWLAYCECLTDSLKRVLFIHSSGDEGSSFF